MRSVVVVLPASICAEIPMFRYRSIGVARATVVTKRSFDKGWQKRLPAVVSEGLVSLSHAVRVFAFADGGTTVLRGVHQLVSKAERHGLLAAVTSSLDDPTHSQCLAASGANFNGYLGGGTTDAARLHPDDRPYVVPRNRQHLDGIGTLLARLPTDTVESAVNDALGSRLLAALHDDVHEFGQHVVVEFRVRQNGADRSLGSTRHRLKPLTSWAAWRRTWNVTAAGH